jgi:hypothetical protein
VRAAWAKLRTLKAFGLAEVKTGAGAGYRKEPALSSVLTDDTITSLMRAPNALPTSPPSIPVVHAILLAARCQQLFNPPLATLNTNCSPNNTGDLCPPKPLACTQMRFHRASQPLLYVGTSPVTAGATESRSAVPRAGVSEEQTLGARSPERTLESTPWGQRP